MTIGLLFWILMLLWVIFGFVWHSGRFPHAHYGPWGNSIFLFILLLLLGWQVFGEPIRG